MARFLFPLLHGLILTAVLVPAKLLKARWLASDAGLATLLELILPDLAFVILLEVAVIWAASRAGARAGRWIQAGWGLLLGPMMSYGVSEHRMFVATGSFMDWSMYWYGVAHLQELKGVFAAELTPLWWSVMLLPIPVGIGLAIAGWRIPPPAPRPGRLPSTAGMLAFCLITMIGWRGGELARDPRVAALRSTIFVSLGRGAVKPSHDRAQDDIDLSGLLPEPVQLEASPDAKPGAKPDNVVIILLESTRASATTPYNPALDTTPFLARMAREGLKVDHGYTLLPHTTKCMVAALCGYPADVRFPLSETLPGALPSPCLPALLKPFGYSSAFFMPAFRHFESNDTMATRNMGFDIFFGLENFEKKGFESPNYLGIEERAMTPKIMEWVDAQRAQDKPFLLSVLTLTSHHDYKLPSYWKMKDYGGSERLSSYLNAVRYTDEWASELFAEFDKRGLLDNTVFVFIGDHGEGHGEHGRKGHDEIMYQEGIHVPFVVWSRHLISKPAVIPGLRQNIDIVPTVTNLLGYKVTHGQFQGKSLLEPVDGRILFASCWYEDRCLGRWWEDKKFIYNFGKHPNEYYDLANDPDERNNLASSLPQAEQDRYIQEMLAWKQGVRDLYTAQKQLINKGFVMLKRPVVDHPLSSIFDKKLELLGYDTVAPLERKQPAKLTFYYGVRKNLPNWRLELKLESQDGKVTPLTAQVIQPKHPTNTWAPGQFMKVEYQVKVPGNVRTGQAHLWVSMKGEKGAMRPVEGMGADPKEKRVDVPVVVR